MLLFFKVTSVDENDMKTAAEFYQCTNNDFGGEKINSVMLVSEQLDLCE